MHARLGAARAGKDGEVCHVEEGEAEHAGGCVSGGAPDTKAEGERLQEWVDPSERELQYCCDGEEAELDDLRVLGPDEQLAAVLVAPDARDGRLGRPQSEDFYVAPTGMRCSSGRFCGDGAAGRSVV